MCHRLLWRLLRVVSKIIPKIGLFKIFKLRPVIFDISERGHSHLYQKKTYESSEPRHYKRRFVRFKGGKSTRWRLFCQPFWNSIIFSYTKFSVKHEKQFQKGTRANSLELNVNEHDFFKRRNSFVSGGLGSSKQIGVLNVNLFSQRL